LHETLGKNTCASALALKNILGTIQLEPISEEKDDFYKIMMGGEFKPYYVAHTKIQTLTLLDSKEKGSNWSHWWRRRESNPRP